MWIKKDKGSSRDMNDLINILVVGIPFEEDKEKAKLHHIPWLHEKEVYFYNIDEDYLYIISSKKLTKEEYKVIACYPWSMDIKDIFKSLLDVDFCEVEKDIVIIKNDKYAEIFSYKGLKVTFIKEKLFNIVKDNTILLMFDYWNYFK